MTDEVGTDTPAGGIVSPRLESTDIFTQEEVVHRHGTRYHVVAEVLSLAEPRRGLCRERNCATGMISLERISRSTAARWHEGRATVNSVLDRVRGP